MKKFLISILLFFILLISIPVLIVTGLNLAAKIVGVVLVLTLSISVRYWMYRTKREFNPKERIRININDQFWMRNELSFYADLSPRDKKVFENRMGMVLSKVPICFSSGELLLDRQLALRIAASMIKDSDLTHEFAQQLPDAIIVEGNFWNNTMEELRSQANVVVIKSKLL